MIFKARNLSAFKSHSSWFSLQSSWSMHNKSVDRDNEIMIMMHWRNILNICFVIFLLYLVVNTKSLWPKHHKGNKCFTINVALDNFKMWVYLFPQESSKFNLHPYLTWKRWLLILQHCLLRDLLWMGDLLILIVLCVSLRRRVGLLLLFVLAVSLCLPLPRVSTPNAEAPHAIHNVHLPHPGQALNCHRPLAAQFRKDSIDLSLSLFYLRCQTAAKKPSVWCRCGHRRK